MRRAFFMPAGRTWLKPSAPRSVRRKGVRGESRVLGSRTVMRGVGSKEPVNVSALMLALRLTATKYTSNKHGAPIDQLCIFDSVTFFGLPATKCTQNKITPRSTRRPSWTGHYVVHPCTHCGTFPSPNALGGVMTWQGESSIGEGGLASGSRCASRSPRLCSMRSS